MSKKFMVITCLAAALLLPVGIKETIPKPLPAATIETVNPKVAEVNAYIEQEREAVSEGIEIRREEQEVSRHKGSTRTIVLEVSAYNPADAEQCSGTGLAYDGKPAIPGRTIAVDPNFIPLGSEIFVPGYGWFKAHDTGSYIKGNRVDIALATNKECFSLGRRNLECIVVTPY